MALAAGSNLLRDMGNRVGSEGPDRQGGAGGRNERERHPGERNPGRPPRCPFLRRPCHLPDSTVRTETASSERSVGRAGSEPRFADERGVRTVGFLADAPAASRAGEGGKRKASPEEFSLRAA